VTALVMGEAVLIAAVVAAAAAAAAGEKSSTKALAMSECEEERVSRSSRTRPFDTQIHSPDDPNPPITEEDR